MATSLCWLDQESPLHAVSQPSCMTFCSCCCLKRCCMCVLHVRINTLHVMEQHWQQPAEHAKHIRSSKHMAHQITRDKLSNPHRPYVNAWAVDKVQEHPSPSLSNSGSPSPHIVFKAWIPGSCTPWLPVADYQNVNGPSAMQGLTSPLFCRGARRKITGSRPACSSLDTCAKPHCPRASFLMMSGWALKEM